LWIKLFGSVVSFAIFLPFLIIGGDFFACFCGIAACFLLKELIGLTKRRKKLPFLTEILSYLAVLYLVLNYYDYQMLLFVIDFRILVVLFLIFFIPIVTNADYRKYSFQDGMMFIGCTLLVGFFFRLLILLRSVSFFLFLYLLLIVIFTDFSSLIIDFFFGKHLLCPKITEEKSVEGLLVGTIIGTIVPACFYLIFINPDVHLLHLLIVSMSLSLIGQLGDLVFFQTKRYYEIDDFSSFIPGRGGLLDCLDSMIFVVLMYTIFCGII